MVHVLGTLTHLTDEGLDIDSHVRFTVTHVDLIPILLEDWAESHHTTTLSRDSIIKQPAMREFIGKWEYIGRDISTTVKNYQYLTKVEWDALWSIGEVDLEDCWLDRMTEGSV